MATIKKDQKLHLINVNFPQITAKHHIYNKFDYELSDLLYDNCTENGIPVVYNFLYKYIKNLSKDKLVVTLSPDPAISASTTCAIAEKYMTIETDPTSKTPKYASNLKVIYFTSTPHLNKELHTGGDNNSFFTSWSKDKNFARKAALYNSNNGVIMTLWVKKSEFIISNLSKSWIFDHESEVQLFGIKTGAIVEPVSKF